MHSHHSGSTPRQRMLQDSQQQGAKDKPRLPAAAAGVDGRPHSQPVHPSWAAKQQQQLLLQSAKPAAKKVVFDDDGGQEALAPVPAGRPDAKRDRSSNSSSRSHASDPAAKRRPGQQHDSRAKGSIRGGGGGGSSAPAAAHPSWQAKKQQEAKLKQLKPSGTKLVFGDD
jgi:hypothetical protein